MNYFKDYFTCFYCGEYATTRDHIIPKSHRIKNINPVTVPACHECNCVLRDIVFNNLNERLSYIKNKLLIRDKSNTQRQEWQTTKDFNIMLEILIFSIRNSPIYEFYLNINFAA